MVSVRFPLITISDSLVHVLLWVMAMESLGAQSQLGKPSCFPDSRLKWLRYPVITESEDQQDSVVVNSATMICFSGRRSFHDFSDFQNLADRSLIAWPPVLFTTWDSDVLGLAIETDQGDFESALHDQFLADDLGLVLKHDCSAHTEIDLTRPVDFSESPDAARSLLAVSGE